MKKSSLTIAVGAALLSGCFALPEARSLTFQDLANSRGSKGRLLLFVEKYVVRDDSNTHNIHLERFCAIDVHGGRKYRIPFRTTIEEIGSSRTRTEIAFNPKTSWLASTITKYFEREEHPTKEKFVEPKIEWSNGREFSAVVLEAQSPERSETRIVTFDRYAGGLSWSPDWHRLAFVTWDGKSYSLKVYGVDKGRIEQTIPLPCVSDSPHVDVSWKDDQDLILTVREDAKYSVLSAGLASNEIRPLSTGEYGVYIGNDKIAYLANDGVRAERVQGGDSTRIYRYPRRKACGIALAASEDGRFLVVRSMFTVWLGKPGTHTDVLELTHRLGLQATRRVALHCPFQSGSFEFHDTSQYKAEWKAFLDGGNSR